MLRACQALQAERDERRKEVDGVQQRITDLHDQHAAHLKSLHAEVEAAQQRSAANARRADDMQVSAWMQHLSILETMLPRGSLSMLVSALFDRPAQSGASSAGAEPRQSSTYNADSRAKQTDVANMKPIVNLIWRHRRS